MKVGGRNINNLRYADESSLLTQRKIYKMLDEVARSNEVKGLNLNVRKTECMVTIKKNHVPILCELKRGEEQIIERDNFRYLGYAIMTDGKYIYIKKRESQYPEVLKNRNIKVRRKLNIIGT